VFTTETMLIQGLNDSEEDLANTASFLGELDPDIAYLAIPTRPPAEGWVQACDETGLYRAFTYISAGVDHAELLLGYEGNAFASSGDAEEDLLSITAVHPMREDAVQQLLSNTDSSWTLVERLIGQRKLVELEHAGHRFYLRRISSL
jgi:wyosine [tRNA(Phe)-imidazoG37] synthetase (radical SAM superfamily)